MRLVFMGTPEFAVPSLRKLNDSPHDVTDVVTVPDRRKGRGLKYVESPVKKAALSMNLPIMQPENLADPVFLNQLQDRSADCYVVVGFRILPQIVYEMPEQGSINLHASLLPKYRGAAPIQWALIKGESETGVTTFFLKKCVDTGDIILQKKTEIRENENFGDLSSRLADLGADLVLRTVDLIAAGNAITRPQSGVYTTAPKITSEICNIDWNKSALSIHNLIRALAPKPGAFSFWHSKRLKIFQSRMITNGTTQRRFAGTVIKAEKKDLWIQTGNDVLAVESCQIAGKSRMTTDVFLRGYPIRPGDRLQMEIKKDGG